MSGTKVSSSRTDSDKLTNEELSVGSSSSTASDTWDSLYNEQGDCLYPALEELTIDENTGTSSKTDQDKESEMPKCAKGAYDISAYSHIVELYNFPERFTTQDLVAALANLGKSENVTIKWVDDTHALAIFTSAFMAEQAMVMNHPFVKVRRLTDANSESHLKAKQCMKFTEPIPKRPDTSSVLARRLVSSALGLRVNIPKEQRERERQKILEARVRKQQAAKQRRDMWEGVYEK